MKNKKIAFELTKIAKQILDERFTQNIKKAINKSSRIRNFCKKYNCENDEQLFFKKADDVMILEYLGSIANKKEKNIIKQNIENKKLPMNILKKYISPKSLGIIGGSYALGQLMISILGSTSPLWINLIANENE